MGDRGTEVHVFIDYVPPAGRLGHWVASLLGQNPRRVVREDLRNFKRIMEIGEIPTIIGQPHGTCTRPGRAVHRVETWTATASPRASRRARSDSPFAKGYRS